METVRLLTAGTNEEKTAETDKKTLALFRWNLSSSKPFLVRIDSLDFTSLTLNSSQLLEEIKGGSRDPFPS